MGSTLPWSSWMVRTRWASTSPMAQLVWALALDDLVGGAAHLGQDALQQGGIVGLAEDGVVEDGCAADVGPAPDRDFGVAVLPQD